MPSMALRLLAALAAVTLPGLADAKDRVKYVGVAIPGIDFDCDIDGTCPLKSGSFPLSKYGGGDGAGQMKHFVEDSGLNTFRLPVTWQWFLQGGKPGDELDKKTLDQYDELMQACLDTGAYCMLDLHNFAHYEGPIIGQGGPTNAQFANTWSQLATKYADQDRVIFGLMNEPHDLDIKLWAATCQAAVTAIRKAGATKNMILLPGTNFASAALYVASGSADALAGVTNPDGSTDNLYFDMHQYLDENNSGTFKLCTTDNIEGFTTIAQWLRKNNRQAMISETGASLDPSCFEKFCAQNNFIAQNGDVFVGFVGWGAGSFSESYLLTLTPLGKPGAYTDNQMMKQCILGPFIKDAPPLSKGSPSSGSDKSKSKSKSKTKTKSDTKTKTKAAAKAKATSHKEEKKPKATLTQQILSEETAASAAAATSTKAHSSAGHVATLGQLEYLAGAALAAVIALF